MAFLKALCPIIFILLDLCDSQSNNYVGCITKSVRFTWPVVDESDVTSVTWTKTTPQPTKIVLLYYPPGTLTIGTDYTGRIDNILLSGSLTLKDVVSTDEGTYKYEVRYNSYSSVQNEANLIVYDTVTQNMSCQNKDNNGTLDCSVPHSSILPNSTPENGGYYNVCMTGGASVCIATDVVRCQTFKGKVTEKNCKTSLSRKRRSVFNIHIQKDPICRDAEIRYFSAIGLLCYDVLVLILVFLVNAWMNPLYPNIKQMYQQFSERWHEENCRRRICLLMKKLCMKESILVALIFVGGGAIICSCVTKALYNSNCLCEGEDTIKIVCVLVIVFPVIAVTIYLFLMVFWFKDSRAPLGCLLSTDANEYGGSGKQKHCRQQDTRKVSPKPAIEQNKQEEVVPYIGNKTFLPPISSQESDESPKKAKNKKKKRKKEKSVTT